MQLLGRVRRILFVAGLLKLQKKERWNIPLLLLLLGFSSIWMIGLSPLGGDPEDNFISFSIHGERLEYVNGTEATISLYFGRDTFMEESVYFLQKDLTPKQISYTYATPPTFDVKFVQFSSMMEFPGRLDLTEKERDDPIQDFFHMVQRRTGVCHKLYRAGGFLTCREANVTQPKMDGHKMICLDPPLQVTSSSSRKTKDCLVLSFGINLDISFDIAVRDANCEVFMFDINEYIHPIADEDEYVNFFQTGLASQRVDEYIKTEDRIVKFNNFNNLALEHGFHTRLINILKMDIEGDEWEILKDMTTRPFLDLIGQIAVEIHAPNLKTMNKTMQEEWIESIRETFSALKERGFRSVSYFDNVVAEKMEMGPGKSSFYSAGELLLTNSKWYDQEFRGEAIRKKFNFLTI